MVVDAPQAVDNAADQPGKHAGGQDFGGTKTIRAGKVAADNAPANKHKNVPHKKRERNEVFVHLIILNATAKTEPTGRVIGRGRVKTQV